MNKAAGFWQGRRLLPSITTESNWKGRMAEVKELALKEVCLFLTFLDFDQRKELFEELKNTEIEKLPLIHLRSDMESGELDHLIKTYKPQALVIHSFLQYPFSWSLEKYRKLIFVENTIPPLSEKEINQYAGICLDLSHLRNDSFLRKQIFEHNKEIIKRSFIGCNHISGVGTFPRYTSKHGARFDTHYFKDFSEFDYLKDLPNSYFSCLLALELEASIKEQLEIKEHIVNMLKNR